MASTSASTTSRAAAAITAALAPSLSEYSETILALQGSQEALTQQLTLILQRLEEEMGTASADSPTPAEIEAATAKLQALLKRQASLRSSLASTEARLLKTKQRFDAAAAATTAATTTGTPSTSAPE